MAKRGHQLVFRWQFHLEMLRSPNNRCSYLNYFLHLMHVKNINKETKPTNQNTSKLNKWSPGKLIRNWNISSSFYNQLVCICSKQQLEVSPKTFKVYWFAGRPTTISGSVENNKKTTRRTSSTTRQCRMEINHQYTRFDFTLIVISNYVLIINILSNNFINL